MIRRKLESGKGAGHMEPAGGAMHIAHEAQEHGGGTNKRPVHVCVTKIAEYGNTMANKLKVKVDGK